MVWSRAGIALTTLVYGEVINRWKVAGIGISILSLGFAVLREPLVALFS
ncbi:MAG: hypothetical protein ACYTGH_03045 [Planctomycetota bacterium]